MAQKRSKVLRGSVLFFHPSEDEGGTEYRAEVKFTSSTPDYFDKAWGNWLPGDPGDAEITGIYEANNGKENLLTKIELTGKEIDNILEDARNSLED